MEAFFFLFTPYFYLIDFRMKASLLNTLKVKDIAQKNVIRIDSAETIERAVELMYQEGHRNVIVTSSNPHHRFGLLTANDLIRMKVNQIDFSRPIDSVKYDKIFSISEETSLDDVLEEVSHEIECLCVTDTNDCLTGVVFYADIISGIDPHRLLEKRTISEIILSQHLKKARSSDPVIQVISLMDHLLNDCVMVFDDDKPAGIITTKDVVRLFGEQQDLNRPVAEFMSSPIETIPYNTSIKESLNFIQRKQFKRLIVEDRDGVIVGQITQGELINRIYSRWSEVLRDNDKQLQEINRALQIRATKFEEMSVIDHLTGIYNRAKFEIELQKEIDRVRRYGSETFSVLFFDVDHFKRVNDRFGHATGDRVLQEICRVISQQMRLTDIVARWGGEEFVAILPSTPLDKACLVAEKLRSTVAGLEFEGPGQVSCSFGVGEFQAGDTFHSVILRVDNAMYQAKANGRNRVEIAG